jgi:hypothetical protein
MASRLANAPALRDPPPPTPPRPRRAGGARTRRAAFVDAVEGGDELGARVDVVGGARILAGAEAGAGVRGDEDFALLAREHDFAELDHEVAGSGVVDVEGVGGTYPRW